MIIHHAQLLTINLNWLSIAQTCWIKTWSMNLGTVSAPYLGILGPWVILGYLVSKPVTEEWQILKETRAPGGVTTVQVGYPWVAKVAAAHLCLGTELSPKFLMMLNSSSSWTGKWCVEAGTMALFQFTKLIICFRRHICKHWLGKSGGRTESGEEEGKEVQYCSFFCKP